MASLETGYRRQKAVLWVVSGNDDYNEQTVDEPVELMVRWTNIEEDALAPDGRVVRVTAMAVVDRDIRPGSLMWLGELTNWRGTGSNDEDVELMEVVQLKKVPGLKGRKIRRTVTMMRYKGALPD